MPHLSSLDTPPAGTVIEIADTSDGWTLQWRAHSRHPVQWIVVLFGALMLFATVMIPFAFLQDEFDNNRLGPGPMELFLMWGFQFSFGAFFLWSGLSRRGRESISVNDALFNYDSGPAPLPLPLMLFFWPIVLQSPNWLGGAGNQPLHVFRKKYSIPVSELGPFALARVGEQQRLTVDHGADRIEIGALLREPEREWLVRVLTEWQESHQ